MKVDSTPVLEAQVRDQGGSRLRSLQGSRGGPSLSLPVPGGQLVLLARLGPAFSPAPAASSGLFRGLHLSVPASSSPPGGRRAHRSPGGSQTLT